MVFGCECIPHLSPMTHNEQGTHESLGVALIMVMSFVDLSSSKSPLAFVVTINDCAFKIVILLLVSLSSLLNTPRKMHKSKLNQNFYTIGRNNELKETSSNLNGFNFYYLKVWTNTHIVSDILDDTAFCILGENYYSTVTKVEGQIYISNVVGNGNITFNNDVVTINLANKFGIIISNKEITIK